MPNLSDGLRDEMERRYKNPSNDKYYITFEDEHNRQLEKDKRWKEQKRAKARKRYHERKEQKKLLAKKEEILTIVRWISNARYKENYKYNKHIDDAFLKFQEIKTKYSIPNSKLQVMCVKELEEANALSCIVKIMDGKNSPFPYTAAILNKSVYPVLEQHLAKSR